MNDPRDAATGMYNSGLQLDEQGYPQPTRDFGSLLRLNSSQMNPLSKGVKPGSFSSLGQPMNSMYANNPGFFRSQIAQRNQSLTPGAPVMTREQRIAQAQQDGTFGTIRDKFNIDNEGAGLSMNKFGNIRKMTEPQKAAPSATGNRPVDNALIEKRGFDSPVEKEPAMGSRLSDMMGDMGRRSGSAEPAIGQRSVTTPAPTGTSAPTPQMSSQQLSNRKALEDRAAGLRLLREMSQTPLQIERSGGETSLQGKYGTGSSTTAGPRQGLINGRPVAEVMQGLANRQAREGTWREGDRLPNAAAGEESSSYDRNTRAGMMSKDQAKKANEEARQKILSRQRIAAKTK